MFFIACKVKGQKITLKQTLSEHVHEKIETFPSSDLQAKKEK